MNALKGLNVIIGSDDDVTDEETDDVINQDINDGLFDAVNEIAGVDISTFTPYLSAFASGFGGGDDAKAKAAAEETAKKAAEAAKREEEQRSKNSKTTLYVVLGIIGVALLGGGTYLVARKR